MTAASPLRHSLIILPFGLALFVSAAAMFMLQLMLGKMLLPVTGGTPAGWIVALAFFQMTLLAGYALAYVLSRYAPRVQGFCYLGLLAVGACFLPVALPHDTGGDIGPLLVLRLLTVSVAVPAIALSATSSTLQRLFTATGHAGGRDPYFLYAASNLGSMAGLLLYPLIVEVSFTLPEQARLIAGGYALLAVLAAICLFFAGKQPAPAESAPAANWKQRGEWIFLAFVPSSVLLGVTTHITTEIIAAPLIWVVPMALYLLTWVIAFSNLNLVKGDKNGEIDKNVTLIALALAVLIMQAARLPWSACWHLMVFMIVALMYHIRLARARPEKTRLSEYYLMIALGGTLGGALNAFVAPVVFRQLVEYPAMMLLACALHPSLMPRFQRKDTAFYAFMASFAAGGIWAVHAGLMALHDFLLLLLFPLTAYIPRVAIPFGIAVLVATYFVQPAVMLHVEPFNIIETDRNFYGVIKVFEQPMQVDDRLIPVRMLQHGTTIHGYQVQAPGYEKVTPGYYDRNGPFGEVFDAFNPRRIAVVGLGAGAIACYGTPENEFTFFEIDPAMIRVAQTQFSFLSDCRAGKEHRLVTGDGRLKLAEETGKFDLIVLDAFSSDMVPAHLLTREAVRMYLDHLAPGGAILFHVSSRYIHLEELLAATADSFNIEHRWKQVDNKGNPLYSGSSWIVMAQQGPGIARLDMLRWPRINPPEGTKPWTDDYSSVLAVLRK